MDRRGYSNIQLWLVLATVLLAACERSADSSASAEANPDDARQVARGAAVYAQHCARCHGVNLEGQPNWRKRNPDGKLPAPPHDASGHTWHHPDQILFEITRNGLVPPNAPEGYESDMPAFAGILPDEDIWAVLAYIKSLWTPEARQHQRDLSRKAS